MNTIYIIILSILPAIFNVKGGSMFSSGAVQKLTVNIIDSRLLKRFKISFELLFLVNIIYGFITEYFEYRIPLITIYYVTYVFFKLEIMYDIKRKSETLLSSLIYLKGRAKCRLKNLENH